MSPRPAPVIHDPRAPAERIRDYFDIQLRFAEHIARQTSRTLPDAYLTFTNLHGRFGFGRVDNGVPSAAWVRYADGLEQCATHRERLDWTLAVYEEAPAQDGGERPFGCFSYELLSAEPIVRIHFSNRDSADGLGPLARGKIERRTDELRAMFAYLGAQHPHVQTVRGGSWLYNIEAYRRLFPPQYAASTFEPERVRLDGTSSWGQLLDFKGCVKLAMRQALLANLQHLDVAAPWKAFPLRALGALAPIEAFYRFYRC